MAKRKTILGITKCGQPTSCAPYAPLGCSTLQEIAEKVCKNVPHDFIISLCMENGCARVELDKLGRHIPLPDSADKTLVEQLNDALCVANGFIESNDTLHLQTEAQRKEVR